MFRIAPIAAIPRAKSRGPQWVKPVLGSSTYLGANASRAELPVRGIAPTGSVQSRDQLAAGFELDRGAREVVADRLAATAEKRREEHFRDGRE
jgi:hypothetical protein